jgi:hypothetical protein
MYIQDKNMLIEQCKSVVEIRSKETGKSAQHRIGYDAS